MAGNERVSVLEDRLLGLRTRLERNMHVTRRNIEGLQHADTLIPLVPGGSHLNWLVGHLVASRDGMLVLLNAEPIWSERRRAPYVRGTQAPESDAAEPFAELVQALEHSQTRLLEVLGEVEPRRLEDGTEGGRGSIGDRLDFLVWHETYHQGQMALYRRIAGREGAI